MRRILITAVSSSALALGVPATALAEHHGAHHHHAHHPRAHSHHAMRARVLEFGGSSTAAPGALASEAQANAGTVSSLKEGVLTITLGDGTPVRGRLSEVSEIHCETATPAAATVGEDQNSEAGESEGIDENGPSGQSEADEQSHQGPSQPSGTDEVAGGQPASEEDQQSCTAAALAPGVVVREAQLSVTASGAVWNKVDLLQ